MESIGHVHRQGHIHIYDSSTTECLLFKQYRKLLLRYCVGVFAGNHHEYCKHHHVIIWERGWRWGVPVIPQGPGQKELHIAGFRIEPKAKYMYRPVYVPSSWLGTGGGENDRIWTIEPYRVYMDSLRANVIGSQMGLL